MRPGANLRRFLACLALGLALLASSATTGMAVNPDEVLADPALELRAREISSELRCLVCQNQSIDDSSADLARDLRLLVRDRLTQGDSNEAVMDYVVSRYGEFVLLKPRLSIRTVLLWVAPLAILAFGIAAIALGIKGRKQQPVMGRLSEEEELEIARLLDGQDDKYRE